MPPRISRSSVPNAVPKAIRSKVKKRTLDAYAAASKEIKEKRIPQHRLGEDLDDEPRYKRRRAEEEDDEEAEKEESDNDQRPRHKRQFTRSIANANDDVQYGSDSSGNEWTMGGLGDDDNDSELDSDEAFGDSDEERFEGFTFRGSSSRGVKARKRRQAASTSRKTRIDLNEDGDEDDGTDDDSQDDVGEGLGEDAVDLAAMLDESDEEMHGHQDDEERGNPRIGSESDEGDLDEDSTEESDLSESGNDSEDEAAEEERVARMMDRLEALDPTRAPHQVPSTIDASGLTLEDLLSGVDAESRRRFEGETKSKKKSRESVVSAPLPKRQQDRLDRELATQKAKEQLDRWRDTVIRNRRAEFLSFPMADANDQSKSLGKERFLPVDDGKHRTELEESIQRIMEESGLSVKNSNVEQQNLGDEEAALLKSEELATNKLSVEEVMRRRAELRKARSLLFREEIKAKRIAKIKSKSYRRVHRKERERLAEQERLTLNGLGSDDDGVMNDEDIERAERRRAEARVSTKHKDSKWSKAMKATNRAVWDENARDSVIDQARRNEELKRRIAGKSIDNSEDELSSSEDGDSTMDVVRNLEDLNRGDEIKGLAGMKFMRAADERRRKANDEDIERLRRELAMESGDEEEEEDPEEAELGRAIFGPQADRGEKSARAGDEKLEFEAPEVSEGEEEGTADRQKTVKPAINTAPKQKVKGMLKHSVRAASPSADAVSTKNEWLTKRKDGARTKQKSNNGPDLILDVATSTSKQSYPADQTDTNADKSHPSESAFNINGGTRINLDEGASDESESEGASNPILSGQRQSELLQRRGFAGDNVEIAFAAEKADVADSEDEKEISNHLPGWGSWTGEGLSRSVRKENQRAKHNPLYKTKVQGVRRADRKDANLENVIISEKQDRKGKKYLAPILPHGYETKAQYERSRRLPMGPEWSTKEVHQRMTRPRVVVKPGVRLEALERPLV